jgi:ribosome-binding factor A
MSIRTERVSKLLQREVADILGTEFVDYLPSMITVTGVRMTRDLSIAYVDVSVLGENLAQKNDTFQHLLGLTPQIRSALAERIRHQMRAIPELRFFLDDSLERAQRMETLFSRIRAEREHRTGEEEGGDEEVTG